MTSEDYDNSDRSVSPSQENALLVLFPDRDKCFCGMEGKGREQALSIRSAAPMRVGNDIPYTRLPGLDAGILHS